MTTIAAIFNVIFALIGNQWSWKRCAALELFSQFNGEVYLRIDIFLRILHQNELSPRGFGEVHRGNSNGLNHSPQGTPVSLTIAGDDASLILMKHVELGLKPAEHLTIDAESVFKPFGED